MNSSINFNTLRTDMIRYLASVKTTDAFPYSLQKGSPGSFYGSCFAVLTAELLNYDLPGAAQIKKEIYARLDNTTGLVENEELDSQIFTENRQHSAQYLLLQTSYFARSALYALNEKDLPPVKLALDLAENSQIFDWLDSLNWNNPWLVSNLDMFLGIFLLEWQKEENCPPSIEVGISEYFRWHEEKQSNIDGFWGANTDPLERMAGGYHIFVIYDAINRKIPYLDEAVVATRKLKWADNLYVYGGGGGACEDMDAIDILVRGAEASSTNREATKAELFIVAERLAFGVNKDGGYSWRVNLPPSWFIHLTKQKSWNELVGSLKALAFKLKNRSHYKSINLYSSCDVYPFKLNISDTWSTWFRASSLAMIAQTSPEMFENKCNWFLHQRPGLGLDPKVNTKNNKLDE